MSPNNGILLSGVLKPKLLNNPFHFCSFTNLDFLLLHTAHFDDNIVLPFLVFNIFNIHSFYLFCTLNSMSACFMSYYTINLGLIFILTTYFIRF